MNPYILAANKAYKNKEYLVALEQYKLGIKELKQKKIGTDKENEAQATALCSLVICQSAIAFNTLSSNLPGSLQKSEKEIVDNLDEAEECSSNFSGKLKTKMEKKITTNRNLAYSYLRNAYWNKADDLIKLAKKGSIDRGFKPKKSHYKNIIKHLKQYLDLTHKITEMDPITKQSDCYAAECYIAEVYDWLSDLYLDSTKSVDPLTGALAKALRYNQKAVTLWGTVNAEEDITILHLGYLNILHHGYIQTKKQEYLSQMSAYISKHLEKTFDDTNIMIEVAGHKLMIATHQMPIDLSLATTLARKFERLKPSILKSQLRFYFDLAHTFLTENATPNIPTSPDKLHPFEFFAQKNQASKMANNKRALTIEPFETKEEVTSSDEPDESDEFQSEDELLNNKIKDNKRSKKGFQLFEYTEEEVVTDPLLALVVATDMVRG